MLPSLSDLKYFQEVAGTSNISRAAERLGITQPSLSAAMKRLEDSVGVQLLIRSRKGVVMTKEGQNFLARVSELLRQWEDTVLSTTRGTEHVSGRYRLGLHPSVALYSLDKFLPSLLDSYPELEVALEHDLSRKIVEGVISMNIDFGLVINPIHHPDLIITKLCKDEVAIYVGPTYKKKKSKGHTLLCDANLLQSQKIMRDLSKQGFEVERTLTSANLEVVASLCASGTGIAILPERVARRIPSYKLKRLSKKLPTFQDELCLIYRADIPRNLGGTKLIEFIKQAEI